MTSERRLQKFLTDDASLVLLIGLAAWEICLYQSEAPPDLGSDALSVWNFCAQTSFRGETSQLASRNVTCFLRLLLCMYANLSIFYNENVPPSLLPQYHVTPLPPRWPLSVESFDRIFSAGMTHIISKLTERLSVSFVFSRSFSGSTLEFSLMKRLIVQIGQTPVCKSSRERHFVEAAVGWARWICWPEVRNLSK